MFIGLIIITIILLVALIALLINRNSIIVEKKKLDEQCNKIQGDLIKAETQLDFMEEYKSDVRVLKKENDELKDIISELQNRITYLETREKGLIEKEKSFKDEFDNLARKILEDNTKKLSDASSIKLNDVLSPFRERLNEFHQKVDDVYVKEGKERSNLKLEIEKLVETHKNLHSQAENLAKALKGDNKAQGNWGEIQLLKILEDSGLVQNQDYIVQGKGVELESDLGCRQQPDVIINLPEGKHIIIDSKVNLVSYERYVNAESKEEQLEHLKSFIGSVKDQVKNLSSKNYQGNEKLGSPDFALMFMPIESAYTLAILEDNSLHNFAWDKKIILCSPSVLFAMLKTIAYGISNDKKNKNIENILKQSESMYDQFVHFLDDMGEIGKFLNKSQDSFESAFKRLKTGRGNLISKAEKIREMGIKVKKTIPESMIEEVLSQDELQSIEEKEIKQLPPKKTKKEDDLFS